MRVNNVKQHNISKVFHILKTWNNTLNFFPIIWPPKSEKVWLWHQSLTSDLSSDRSTWTCRCPSSSTRPPVRTPTAPAPQGTTPCSPTTRCLTSPVFPNSFPVTGWLGHKNCAGGGRTLTSSHSLWQKYHRSLTQAPQDTERDKKEKKENSACNTSTVLQLFLICLKLSDKALFRVFFFSSSPRTLFKHWRIFFFLPLNHVCVLLFRNEIIFLYSGQSFVTDNLWGETIPCLLGLNLLRLDLGGGNEGHWWVTCWWSSGWGSSNFRFVFFYYTEPFYRNKAMWKKIDERDTSKASVSSMTGFVLPQSY